MMIPLEVMLKYSLIITFIRFGNIKGSGGSPVPVRVRPAATRHLSLPHRLRITQRITSLRPHDRLPAVRDRGLPAFIQRDQHGLELGIVAGGKQ